GQPSLGVPTRSGMILIEITQCRDIQAILSKYGLPGPATRNIDVAESDEMIANGATRWYRVAVAPGTESEIVVELYKHPEDIEYVQLIPEFTGGAAGDGARAARAGDGLCERSNAGGSHPRRHRLGAFSRVRLAPSPPAQPSPDKRAVRGGARRILVVRRATHAAGGERPDDRTE